jgi:hypothetical protein
MTARADEVERRVAGIELRLTAIDVLLVDVHRWLIETLMSNERSRLGGTSEAGAQNRLLNALEHPAVSPSTATIPEVSSGGPEDIGLPSLAAWVNWVAVAFDLSERWPSCWYRHAGLVFEMESLRRWHVALRVQFASDPSSATRWSEALHRVNAQSARHIAQRCLSTHRDAPPLDPVDVHTDEESTAMVARHEYEQTTSM